MDSSGSVQTDVSAAPRALALRPDVSSRRVRELAIDSKITDGLKLTTLEVEWNPDYWPTVSFYLPQGVADDQPEMHRKTLTFSVVHTKEGPVFSQVYVDGTAYKINQEDAA